jgi:hypothetical protein
MNKKKEEEEYSHKDQLNLIQIDMCLIAHMKMWLLIEF